MNMNCRQFEYKGAFRIKFKGTITVSMRGCSYESCVSFTSSKLLCCKCNCPIGAQKDQCITCVHNLPVILKFAMLLMDGLAEHILLELVAKVTTIPGYLELLNKDTILKLILATEETISDE